MLLVIGFVLLTPGLAGQELTITTFAGPQELPGIADGLGAGARFKQPTGVAVDHRGNIYVADEFNHTIRKVSPSGAVTTLAGLIYTQGQSDGPGHVARFVFPHGVATDDSGNVFVADTFNNMIRKITPEGVVSSLAGFVIPGSADGVGRNARFSYPEGLTIDRTGTVYVADTLNHTIRKITPDGAVTTLAGLAGTSGAADGIGATSRFYNPGGVAADDAGNVYVVDTWNHTIRKISQAGTVTTFCGAPGERGSANGLCTAARFAYPQSIAIDREGDIYVADTFNYCIRKVTKSGIVTTVAGSPDASGSDDGDTVSARFDRPASIAVDDAGNIYVAEETSATLRRISGGRVTTIAGIAVASAETSVDATGHAARFGFPIGIAADGAGNIYVGDYGNFTIRKVTTSGEVTTFAGVPGIDGSADGAGSAALFAGPRGLACDPAGNLYVADSQNNTIRKITPAGTVTTLAGSVSAGAGTADGSAAAARFDYPWGVATDAGGNVYVADSRNHSIRRVTPAGVVTTIAGHSGSSGSADGTGPASRFREPHGVAVDGAGNVFIADTENHTIRKITPAGVVTTVAGLAGSAGSTDGIGSAARFQRPSAVAVERNGTIYVTEVWNNTIRRIDLSGAVTTVAGRASGGIITGALEGIGTADGTGGEAQFHSPGGLALAANGNLYVADSMSRTIRLGRPALEDVATISAAANDPEVAQFDTSSLNATTWEWRIIRRPADARANLSATTIRNPTFRPDVPGLFLFRLTASGPAGARISHVGLVSTSSSPLAPRRRSARH